MNTRYFHPIGFALVLLLCLAMFASGCSIPVVNTPTGNIGSYAPLVIKLEVDHSWAKVGEPVQIRLTTINDGQQPFIIESSDQAVLDIVVQDVNSQKILLSWAVQNPDKVSHRVEWKPSQSMVMETTWIPPQEEDGRPVHISGLLSKNSRYVYDVSVLFYVGQSGP